MFLKIIDAFRSQLMGVFIGILGILIGIYFAVSYERQGELIIREDGLSRVFDVSRPVGGLEISYLGQNLRDANKTLWILTLTIENRGNAPVRKVDFDDAVPFGIKILGAELVEQPQIASTTKYLLENARVKSGGDIIELSPIIFEPGESLQLTIVLLGSEVSKPVISSQGKLVGQRHIEFSPVDDEAEKGKYNLFYPIVPGSSWGSIAFRVLGLFIFLMGFLSILIILIGFALVYFVNFKIKFDARRRRRAVAKLRDEKKVTNDLRSRLLIGYEKKGEGYLRSVRSLLETAKRREDFFSNTKFSSTQEREKFIEAYGPIAIRFFDAKAEELGIADFVATTEGQALIFCELESLCDDLSIELPTETGSVEDKLVHLIESAKKRD